MKFLVVFACALAAASAGGLVTPLVYAGEHPVIGSNGVPVDTAAVQQARAEHLVHKVDAHLRNGDYAVASPVVSTYAAPVAPLTYSAVPSVSTYSHNGLVASTYTHAPVVSTYTSQFLAHLRKRRHVVTPVTTYSAVASPLAYSGAYAHNGLVASTYSHTPFVSTYSAPVVAHGVHAVHYRKRRGLVAPVAAYSAVGTPVAYSAAPVVSTYAHNPLVTGAYATHPFAYSTPFVHHY